MPEPDRRYCVQGHIYNSNSNRYKGDSSVGCGGKSGGRHDRRTDIIIERRAEKRTTWAVGNFGFGSVVVASTMDASCNVRPTTVSVGPGCPWSHLHVTVMDETGTGYGPKATIPGQVWVRRLQPMLPVV